MVKYLQSISDVVNSVVEKITILLISVISLLTAVGVVSRYVLNLPIIWVYETTLVAFVWMVFLGVSIGFKRREHITLDIIIDRMPPTAARILHLLIAGIVGVFFLFVIKEGCQVVKDTAPEYYHTIRLSTGWFYAAFPVSAAIALLHLAHEIALLLFNPAAFPGFTEKQRPSVSS